MSSNTKTGSRPRHLADSVARGSLSLVELLEARASQMGDRRALTFLEDGERDETNVTYAFLAARAKAIALELTRRGARPGDRVLLLYPPGIEYVAGFFGCLYAGLVAVPAYPPDPARLERTLPRITSVVADCRATAVLSTSAIVQMSEFVFGMEPALAKLLWIATDELAEADTEWDSSIDPHSLAFLQYTSGSTGDPKGVMLTHANLLHNSSLIFDAFELSTDSVGVIWLPPYHDMGLIGGILQPIYAGFRSVLMSPIAFLQRPLRWLEAISRYRGTVSGGPNFAFDLCVRKSTPEQRQVLDLSSWQVAFCGAEPIRPETVARFEQTFAEVGYRRRAFYPCYGLAESTLLVTGIERSQGIVTAELDRTALGEGRAIRVDSEHASAQRLVGSGVARHQDVRIVDPATGEECADGSVGEVWIRGASVGAGYWERVDATREVFGAHEANGEGPYLRTGDLAVLLDRQLFVVGRSKDLVIIRGRNHYPQDIERTVEECHPAIRPGCGAAFAIEANRGEGLVIVQEIERRYRADRRVRSRADRGDRRSIDMEVDVAVAEISSEERKKRTADSNAPPPPLDHNEICEAIRESIALHHDLSVVAIVLVRAGTVPKTSSGKIRRRACREAFENGLLETLYAWTVSTESSIPAAVNPGLEPAHASLQQDHVSRLLQRAAAIMRLPPREIDVRRPISRYGLDSLMAVDLQHAIESEFGVEVALGTLLRGPTLSDLAAQIATTPKRAPGAARAKTDAPDDDKMSAGQRALWFVQHLDPASASYNVARALRIHSPVRGDLLRRAFDVLRSRHGQLRVGFEDREGTPSAIESQPRGDWFAEVDVSTIARDEFERHVAEEAGRPFDLAQPPLMRVRLYRNAREQTIVLFVVHHIVADFWSLGVLVRELGDAYASLAAGREPALPELPTTFESHAVAEAAWLRSAAGAESIAYWRRRLGDLPTLQLVTDRARPPIQTYRGATCTIEFSAALTDALRAFATRHDLSLFVTLLSAYAAVLMRQSDQREVVIGVPSANRGSNATSEVFGYFVNMLALRIQLDRGASLSAMAKAVRETLLDALEHDAVPFVRVVEAVESRRDPSRAPIFQTSFVLQQPNARATPGIAALAVEDEDVVIDVGGMRASAMRLPHRTAMFDLGVMIAETGRGLTCSIEYNADLFDPTTIESIARQYRTVLAQFVDDSSMPVDRVQLAAPDLARIAQWNESSSRYPRDESIHDLVAQAAARTPEEIAIVADDATLTYRDLESRANQLAHHLVDRGVQEGDCVGVALSRSASMVVTLLAVLKAGAAYVPIDPAMPLARREQMLEDVGVRFVVSDDGASFDGSDVVRLGDPRIAGCSTRAVGRRVDPLSLAYVVFTSGSTGRPKGVAVPHRGVVRLVHGERYLRFGAHHVFIQLSPVAFDASTFEIWGALIHGARLVVPPPGVLALPDVAQRVLEGGVTAAFLTTGLFNALVDEHIEAFATLTDVLSGGEVASPGHWATLRARWPELRCVHVYGPTENTTFTTSWIAAPTSSDASLPIGSPIDHTSVYVLDDRLQPVPIGVPGELYTGGDGVAHFYANAPALTAERFGPDPFSRDPGARMYRTGDIARWRADGLIEFLGRRDGQVKIRGFRVEVGEVEFALRRLPYVRDALVTAVDAGPGDRRLVAYVVGSDDIERVASEVRRDVAAMVPEYMVPAAVVRLDALPLNRNGKVDRAALPRPSFDDAHAQFAAPRTQQEELIVGIWRELLDNPTLGIDDNFFESGGHSLLATRVVSRLRKALSIEVPLKTLFAHPTVRGLAAAVAAIQRVDERAIDAIARDTPPLASFAQERLWFLDQLAPGSAAYNMPGVVTIHGRLDLNALHDALTAVVQRHEALRTTFSPVDGRPVQIIAPVARFEWHHEDVATDAVDDRIRAITMLPFDLARGPLLRAWVLRTAPERWILVFSMHHIIGDGWSYAIIVRELCAAYAARIDGKPVRLEPLAIQYADFAAWQRRWVDGSHLERSLEYWKNALAGAPRALEFPTDRPRPATKGDAGGKVAISSHDSTYSAVCALAGATATTPFMVLLAAWALTLSKHAGQSDLVIGAPVAGRTRADVESIVGFFANTLALRVDLDGNPDIATLLERIRKTTLGAYEHQDTPFERIVDALDIERDPSRTPVFQAAFGYENTEPLALKLPGLDVRLLDEGNDASKFDLTLMLAERRGELIGRIEYDSQLFDRSTIERLADRFVVVLSQVVTSPRLRVNDVTLFTPADRVQLAQANDTRRMYPWEGGIVGHFERVVARAPSAVAVRSHERSLTYAALDAESNRLARHLIRLGVRADRLVGVMMERAADMIVALCGIMKAGGAYVPIDPDYPPARLAYVLEDSGVDVVITQRAFASRLGSIDGTRHVVVIDASDGALDRESSERPRIEVSPNDLAYMIYTSGSTGRPKGAMNTHGAIANRLLWMQEAFELSQRDVVLQKTPFGFDVSVWEFFWPLMTGASIAVAKPGGHRDPAYLTELLVRENVTTLHFVPSMLAAFLADPHATFGATVTRVICSGEALSHDLQQRFFARAPQASLHNLYGPTEAAVDVTHWECRRESTRSTVPIGKPIANTTVYVLDRNMSPLPVGIVGELYLGGVQLARGYHGRTDLTADRFVPDPFAAGGARMYRTGDLARWLPDGNVEYIGRTDFQVKLRGFRIELGEIEAALLQNRDVQDAVAVVREDGPGDRRLVAYVVPGADAQAVRTAATWTDGGADSGAPLHAELPNGLAVSYVNRGELDFLFREIFIESGYLRYGIAIRDGDVVVDVGANIGLFALFVHFTSRDATIFAFEPIPTTARALRTNMDLHRVRGEVFDIALGDTDEVAMFTYYANNSILSGRFADADTERRVVEAYMRDGSAERNDDIADLVRTRLADQQQIACRVRRLSDVMRERGIDRIDLLKIDVEKAELAVLGGIDAADWAKVRQAVIEVHDVSGRLSAIRALLEHHGFEVAVEQDHALAQTDLFNVYAVRRDRSDARPVRTQPIVPPGAGPHHLAAALRDDLRKTLPEHMVPSAFVWLDRLPLNTSGKIDRAALPAPTRPDEVRGEAPRTDTERLVASICRALLGFDLPRDRSFFDAGGHSLLATQLLSRVRTQTGAVIAVSEFFAAPTIAATARWIETRAHRSLDQAPISAVPRTGPLAVSSVQARLAFLEMLEPTLAYNLPVALRIVGALDVRALQRAVLTLQSQHEALRTTVESVSGQIVQAVHPTPLAALEVSEFTVANDELPVESWIRDEVRKAFDTQRGPLIRFALRRVDRDVAVLVVTVHHIVADGWSVGLLVDDLRRFYAAEIAGSAAPSKRPALGYPDYAAWHNEWIRTDACRQEVTFWTERLRGAPTSLDLPFDRPRPRVMTQRGAVLHWSLDRTSSEALHHRALAANATLFMATLAGFLVVLSKYSGQTDLVVGTPVAGRVRPEFEQIVGMFVNTLALRVDLTGTATFDEVLDRTRSQTLEALAHQSAPFEMVVEAIRPDRDTSRTPVFQVMFAYQNTQQSAFSLAGTTLEVLPVDAGFAKFDLTLNVSESDHGLAGVFEYNADLFDPATIERLRDAFVRVLGAVARNPRVALRALPLLDAGERARVVDLFNDTSAPIGYDRLLHSPFVDCAIANPSALAVVAGARSLTYGQLFSYASAIASALRERGAGPGALVGIRMHKDIEPVAAMLGILMSGGAYLPIDPHLPIDRVRYIVSHAGVRHIVTQQWLVDLLEWPDGIEVITADSVTIGDIAPVLGPSLAAPSDVAYVIYTSGSTGRPKGVAIEHRSALNTVLDVNARHRIGPDDRVLALSSFSFDLSVYDVFGTLAAGGAIVMPAESDVPDPAPWTELVERHGVTIWNSVPALMELACDHAATRASTSLASLKHVFLSGDWIGLKLPDRIRALAPRARVISMGGATEASIWSNDFLIETVDPAWKSIPYGYPMANQRFYVLDPQLEPAPVGVPGELYIGGIGVARGYWNDVERTAASFVTHPVSGERLYRTGDLGRHTRHGWMEFLGRKDFQVKIHGFRIELGEIETVLATHPGVRDAVVMAVGAQPDARLVAYVVPNGEVAPEVGALLRHVGDRVPSYMVPTSVILLASFPLGANGKVDRKALPAPVGGNGGERTFVAAQNAVESEIVDSWKSLLARDRIGRDDNFFEVGGHSLLMVRLRDDLSRRLGRDVSIVDLFAHPTPAALARHLESAARASDVVGAARDVAADRINRLGAQRRRRG